MTIEGKIPRTGSKVLLDGEAVGEITSGTQSPSLGYPRTWICTSSIVTKGHGAQH